MVRVPPPEWDCNITLPPSRSIEALERKSPRPRPGPRVEAKGLPTRLLAMDTTNLRLPDASYDQALIFFLLHEQPSHYRERTLSELFRVVRPGGKIIVVDYARPRWWHPLRYIWQPLLANLEPFALDLWRNEIAKWLPRKGTIRLRKQTYFGGLYQKVVVTR